jgi:hypothetical protein
MGLVFQKKPERLWRCADEGVRAPSKMLTLGR